MYLSCEVTQTSFDDLERERYVFILFDRGELSLTSYERQNRTTKRHKWNTLASYSWYGGRDNTLTFADVPKSKEIEEAALQALLDQITVVWNRKR